MREIAVSDARARLADVVDAARVGHDPVYLTRRGQRVAAVIDADDLDRLVAAAEDLADIQAAAAARAEMDAGVAAIPWEQVKADLGLTDIPRPGRSGRDAPASEAGPRGAAPDTGCHRAVGRPAPAERGHEAGRRRRRVGRVRTGAYRIVYQIHDEVLLVLVVAVGHRRDVFQRR